LLLFLFMVHVYPPYGTAARYHHSHIVMNFSFLSLHRWNSRPNPNTSHANWHYNLFVWSQHELVNYIETLTNRLVWDWSG
jgi:hypothetical protein